jgi:hypothetical protein
MGVPKGVSTRFSLGKEGEKGLLPEPGHRPGVIEEEVEMERQEFILLCLNHNALSWRDGRDGHCCAEPVLVLPGPTKGHTTPAHKRSFTIQVNRNLEYSQEIGVIRYHVRIPSLEVPSPS